MFVLALDTCDARGSVAVLHDSVVVASLAHPGDEEYSSWLIPAADAALASCGLTHAALTGYAVACGPGSFTGVRVGLTTAKGWGEAFGKPIAGVSRLEALASASAAEADFVATFVDAHRAQLFGGLYRREGESLVRIGDEVVAPPAAFLDWVLDQAATERIAWVSLDPHILTGLERWNARAESGERVEAFAGELAPRIGLLGLRQFVSGQATDSLKLDANYVRRSDAELLWKKSAAS